MILPLKRLVLFIVGKLGYTIMRLPTKGPVIEVAAIAEGGRPPQPAPFSVGTPKLAKKSRVTPPKPKNPSLKPLRINMHHVGGRSGGFPMPLAEKFHDGTEMYIYDADPDCKAQMVSSSPYVDHVIVAAVGGVDAEADFYVNYDPFTSSLLKPHPGNAGIFYQDASCDYILEDVLKPLKAIKVTIRTLGELAREHGFQVDYLSLDVQGAEFDLLSGVSDAIFRDTVGVMCEISLLQFYDRQKLFDEITALLRPKGFFVANIFPHGYDWATYRSTVGWRGTGFTAHGDVLFLRDPRHIVEHAGRPFLSLLKLAFVSMCYGNVAYALQCLEEAYKNPESDVLAAKGEISYIGFLDDMYRLYCGEDHIYPPRFSHLWTAEESLARFKDGAVVNQNRENIRKAEIRSAYFSENDKETFFRIAPRLLSPLPTAFEELLEKNGFSELANRVREKRVTSIKQTLGALGIQVVNGNTQQGSPSLS